MVSIIATRAQQERVNFLLELASALNGVGVKIGRAVIQSCRECGTPVKDPDFPTEDEAGRLYKIWGTDRSVCRSLEALEESGGRVKVASM